MEKRSFAVSMDFGLWDHVEINLDRDGKGVLQILAP